MKTANGLRLTSFHEPFSFWSHRISAKSFETAAIVSPTCENWTMSSSSTLSLSVCWTFRGTGGNSVWWFCIKESSWDNPVKYLSSSTCILTAWVTSSFNRSWGSCTCPKVALTMYTSFLLSPSSLIFFPERLKSSSGSLQTISPERKLMDSWLVLLCWRGPWSSFKASIICFSLSSFTYL